MRNRERCLTVWRAVNRMSIALLPLFLSACAVVGGPPNLDGTSFLSTAVTEGGQDRPLVDGTRIRLGFRDGQLSANAGCNTFGGSYRMEGDRLTVEGGAMTEMGCDEPRAAQDEWLFGLLGSRPALARDGDELVLTADDTVITLLDSEVAEPDLALVGPTWTVESIIVGETVASVPAGAAATMTFADDGTLSAETGCNTGGAQYEVEDGELRLSPFEQTLVGCDGPAGELEEAVVAVLNARQVRYAIDADTLTLMAGDRGVVLRGS